MKELAFNVVSRDGLTPLALQRIFATLQPAGVLEPLAVERGDRIAFVAGFGTARQALLARKTCKSVQRVLLDRAAQGEPRMELDGVPQLQREIHWIALEMGYGSPAGLIAHFEKTCGLPFNGTLLRW